MVQIFKIILLFTLPLILTVFAKDIRKLRQPRNAQNEESFQLKISKINDEAPIENKTHKGLHDLIEVQRTYQSSNSSWSQFIIERYKRESWHRIRRIRDFYGSELTQEPARQRFMLRKYLTFFASFAVSGGYFESVLIPKSTVTPVLVVLYNNECLQCVLSIEVFEELGDLLSCAGIDFVSLDIDSVMNSNLRMGDRGLKLDYTGLALLLDKDLIRYPNPLYTLEKILLFLRFKLNAVIPIAFINDNNVAEFLANWFLDSHIRALIFAQQDEIDLKYLVTAFNWRRNVDFGIIKGNETEATGIRRRFQGSSANKNSDETIVLFHEDSKNPVSRFVAQKSTQKDLKNFIDPHKYLKLPRLSSQQVFDDLCPTLKNASLQNTSSLTKESTHQKHLCIVFLSENSDSHKNELQKLREIALENEIVDGDHLRYSYVDWRRQVPFVEALMHRKNLVKKNFAKLCLIWRQTEKESIHFWLNKSKPHDMKLSVIQGVKYLQVLNKLETHLIILPRLYDEFETKTIDKEELLLDFDLKAQIFMATSLVMMLIFAVFNLFTKSSVKFLSKPSETCFFNDYPPPDPLPPPILDLMRSNDDMKENGRKTMRENILILFTHSELKPLLVNQIHFVLKPYFKTLRLHLICIVLGDADDSEWSSKFLEANTKSKSFAGAIIIVNSQRKYFMGPQMKIKPILKKQIKWSSEKAFLYALRQWLHGISLKLQSPKLEKAEKPSLPSIEAQEE